MNTEPLHVDEFIEFSHSDDPKYGDLTYARYMLWHWRLPAMLMADFHRFTEGRKLFCTYEGERYRCTGASRLGDVWLTTNVNQGIGYEKRVDVAKCEAWSDKL